MVLALQVEDDAGSGSDSDFTILDDKKEISPVRERKPFAGRDSKPKINKPAEYRHAIAREALTNEWEEEVNNMPDRASKTLH